VFLLGILLALGTAVTTGTASILQALAVRADRAGSPLRAVIAPQYLAGTALDLLGFVCMVGALRWLPLFLVQCAATASVGVTALLSRPVFKTRLRPGTAAALTTLTVGLILLAAGARPGPAAPTPRATQGWFALAAAVLLVAAALLLRMRRTPTGLLGMRRAPAGLLAGTAGLAFAATGIAARMLSGVHTLGAALTSLPAYVLIACGAMGMLLFAAALRHAAVTLVTAVVFAVETLTASAVGLAVLGDETRRGFVVPTAIGFVVALGSAITLTRDAAADGPHVTPVDQAAR
jgi:drug/metabolite transporter (DMT)-like permease